MRVLPRHCPVVVDHAHDVQALGTTLVRPAVFNAHQAGIGQFLDLSPDGFAREARKRCQALLTALCHSGFIGVIADSEENRQGGCIAQDVQVIEQGCRDY